MYSTNTRVSDYVTRDYRVEVNADWITIKNTNGIVLAQRHADNGPWMDELHQKAVNALVAFEKAIFDLVDAERNARKTT